MSDFSYTIRNYHLSDFNNYIQLNIEAEELDPTGRCISAQTIGEYLGRPNYLPEQDLFIAEIAGRILGHMDVTSELGIGRVVLDCFVHPDHRRMGLATHLFHHAIHRAKELGVRVAHVNISQNNIGANKLLSKLGFGLVRHYLDLKLELSEVHLPHTGHTTSLYRHLTYGEEDRLTELQNRSFVDTWGYNPNTVEEIVYRLNQGSCSPADVILICEGEHPIGYCWTIVNFEQGTVSGSNKGRIYMLGTDPDCRGKGIGKQVLLAGLAYLEGMGIKVAELTVDRENEVACALYESVGFKIASTSLWYEKSLD